MKKRAKLLEKCFVDFLKEGVLCVILIGSIQDNHLQTTFTGWYNPRSVAFLRNQYLLNHLFSWTHRPASACPNARKKLSHVCVWLLKYTWLGWAFDIMFLRSQIVSQSLYCDAIAPVRFKYCGAAERGRACANYDATKLCCQTSIISVSKAYLFTV